MKKIRCFTAGIYFPLMLISSVTTVCATCGQSSVTISELPTLGGTSVSAAALNDVGQIAGFSFLTGDVTGHAFIFNGNAAADLGTLGGSFSEAFALNHSGQVVGDASTFGDQAPHAFLANSNGITDLGTLGGWFSAAFAINDSGVVVGDSDTLFGQQHAFVYANGSMTNLGTLGGAFSSAAAVNQGGMIVGMSSTAGDMAFHAFLRVNGTMLDLGTLGGNYSAAFALNDSGAVVGESTLANGDTHGFILSGGTMSDIGTLGGTYSTVNGVNSSDMVFGVATTANNAETHGFVFSGGIITDLGTLGGSYSEANGINNAGQVVGRSTTPTGDLRAFLWQNGTLTDLNSLLPTNSGWTLQSALFINDAGRIVGYGDHGGYRWFVMDLASSDQPPVAVIVQSQAGDCHTPVTLDGSHSNDPEGDALTYSWSENNTVLGTNSTLTTLLDLGTHTVTLLVSDPCGHSAQTNVTVQITDTLAPTISGVPASVTIPAGDNCQAAVPNVLADLVATDNCTPASQLVAVQDPAAGTVVDDGTYPITVTVTDAAGNAATGYVILNVVDKTPPTIVSAPDSIANSNGLGLVPNILPLIVASDNCTPADQLILQQFPAAGSVMSADLREISVTVTDASGNRTSRSIPLTFGDTAPPSIKRSQVTPSVLWPPNHKMVKVTVAVLALDNLDPAPVSKILSITANEPVSPDDVQITGNLTAKLAASRNPAGRGRIYTIHIECRDASGNASTCAVNVLVPLNKGGKNNR